MSNIVKVCAREILDSRGNPTIEVEIYTKNGSYGFGMVPSGASIGENEAIELRDFDKTRYFGKGVNKAISNINNIISKYIIGLNVLDQVLIDNILIELDGTKNKSKIGANAILGVSIAVARAAANFCKLSLYNYLGGFNAKKLPIPMINIINGGVHSNNKLSFQEFMIMPVKYKKFKESLRISVEIFYILKKILKEEGYSIAVGDEGGFAPNLSSNEEALQLIIFAIKKAGYIPGKDIYLSLDIAASEFYDKKNKIYKIYNCSKIEYFSLDDMIKMYNKLILKYPIFSIEDPLYENDWDGFKKISNFFKNKIQIVGDDLFTTNLYRLNKGIKNKIANSILIKLNQIGTLTETFDVIEKAKEAGYNIIISHRSGETEDTFISDLSVAVNSMQIKTGSLSRTDRISKYNRLLKIEKILGNNAIYDNFEIFEKIRNRN